MGMKESFLKGIVSAALPMALDYAIDQMDDVRAFLLAEAQKTDNKLDDLLVETGCDWAIDFLKGVRDSL